MGTQRRSSAARRRQLVRVRRHQRPRRARGSAGAAAQGAARAGVALEKRGDGATEPLAPPAPTPPAQLLPGAVFAQGPLENRKLALLFPGQGAQRVGLLREAYERIPAFRERLEQLDPEGSLRACLYAQPSAEAEKRLTATEICQPAMAALGLALHALLERMGVKADMALGHSLGEFAAAAAAGFITAEDCVRLVARRGQAMVDLNLPDAGAMASAAADPAAVADALRDLDGVVIANLNHPRQTVISGTTAGVKAAGEKLQASGVQVTQLDVSHAFHSPLLRGVESAMRSLVEPLQMRAASMPVVSAITGVEYPADPRDVWVRHATSPVDFVSALRGRPASRWRRRRSTRDATRSSSRCRPRPSTRNLTRQSSGRPRPSSPCGSRWANRRRHPWIHWWRSSANRWPCCSSRRRCWRNAACNCRAI